MSRSRLRAFLFPAVTVVGTSALTYLVIEGLHSDLKGSRASTSLAYSLWAGSGRTAGVTDADRRDAASRVIASLATIKPMLASMKENGVALGNAPFPELKTEEVSINEESGGCLRQKPNLRKKVGFLRSNLFNPFDQITFFWDADRELPDDLRAFFERYAFRTVLHTTNAFGERRTVPEVDAERVVLIAGDSVANGALLDDSETLASRMQDADRSRRYVNLGIVRANTRDIECALEAAANRYRGRMDEVVYVLCENDFADGRGPSGGDDVAAWLDAFRTREHVGRVTIVYAPYIYNALPDVTRMLGHSHYDWPTYSEQKVRTLDSAAARGMRTVDFLDIVEAERKRVGSQFASLALYVDQVHWSALGAERVAQVLREPDDGRRAALP